MSEQASDALSNLIDLPDLQRYLRYHGWDQFPDRRNEVRIYRRADTEVVLPISRETFFDYEDLLNTALKKVANVEQMRVRDVIDLIISPSADILQFRLMDQSTDAGKISLEMGLSLLTGAAKALTAVACSVVKPQKYHPRMRRTEVDAFMSACELGQTKRGSYVAQIVCPISRLSFEDPQLQLGLYDNETTFGRRVTTSFITALDKLVEGIEQDTVQELLDNEPMVSSNLCQALASMQPESTKASLFVASEWDRSTKTPKASQKVQLKQHYFPIIEQIGTALRSQSEQPKTQTFLGIVDELKGAPGKDGKVEGDVVLRILTPDDEMLKARITLASHNYEIAGRAHLNADVVLVQAELHRHQRLHELKNCTVFIDMEGDTISKLSTTASANT